MAATPPQVLISLSLNYIAKKNRPQEIFAQPPAMLRLRTAWVRKGLRFWLPA
jgi:hypothetical protein